MSHIKQGRFEKLTALVFNDNLAVRTSEFLVDVNAGLVQDDVGKSVLDVELVLLQNDGLQNALDLFSLSSFVDDFLAVDGRETDLQLVGTFVAVLADLPLETSDLVERRLECVGTLLLLIAIDLDAPVLALVLGELGAGAEVPFLVQCLQSVDDLGLQDAFAGVVAQNVGNVSQLNLEDLLGLGGLGAGRINHWCVGVGVEVGTPEPFGSAGVKVRNRLRESKAFVAENLADLEPTTWTPVFAVPCRRRPEDQGEDRSCSKHRS